MFSVCFQILACQGKDKILTTLFEDYVQSGENWFRSSLLIQSTKSTAAKKRGRHVMMPLKDVRQKFGPAIAASILAEKKALEAKKGDDDPVCYYMEHPEAKGQEEFHQHYDLLHDSQYIIYYI